MQLDDHVLLGALSEPSVEYLGLARVEIVDARRLGQAVEYLARVDGLGLALAFAQLLEVDHQRALVFASLASSTVPGRQAPADHFRQVILHTRPHLLRGDGNGDEGSAYPNPSLWVVADPTSGIAGKAADGTTRPAGMWR